MNKKRITAIAIITAVLLIGVFLYMMPKSFGKGIDPKQVHHINVFDGQTGEGFTIDDPAQIRHIVQNIQSIPMHRDGISMGRMGYGFKISYIDENDRDVVPLFYMNSDDTIRKDPFFYRCEGGLGFDYLKELEADILGSSTSDSIAFAPVYIDGVAYYYTGVVLPIEPDESTIEYLDTAAGAEGPSISAWVRIDDEALAVRIDDEWWQFVSDGFEIDKDHDEIDQSLSIGIIGGADGPTAIFVTGSVNWPKMIAFLGGLAVLIVVGIVLIKKKRSKQ